MDSPDPVIDLIQDNLPLISKYLSASPVLRVVVKPRPFSGSFSESCLSSSSSSSSSSCMSSPDFLPHANSSYSSFLYEIPATLVLSAGKVLRAGIVKVRLVNLLECLMNRLNLPFIHALIVHDVIHAILVGRKKER